MAHVALPYFFSTRFSAFCCGRLHEKEAHKTGADLTEKRSHVFPTQRSLKGVHMACTQTSEHALAQRDAIHSFALSFLQPPPATFKKKGGISGGPYTLKWQRSLPCPLLLSHSWSSAPPHPTRGKRLGVKWITPTDSVRPHWTELIRTLSEQMFEKLDVIFMSPEKENSCTLWFPCLQKWHLRTAYGTVPAN